MDVVDCDVEEGQNYIEAITTLEPILGEYFKPGIGLLRYGKRGLDFVEQNQEYLPEFIMGFTKTVVSNMAVIGAPIYLLKNYLISNPELTHMAIQYAEQLWDRL